jgi:hypothetical protein
VLMLPILIVIVSFVFAGVETREATQREKHIIMNSGRFSAPPSPLDRSDGMEDWQYSRNLRELQKRLRITNFK